MYSPSEMAQLRAEMNEDADWEIEEDDGQPDEAQVRAGFDPDC